MAEKEKKIDDILKIVNEFEGNLVENYKRLYSDFDNFYEHIYEIFVHNQTIVYFKFFVCTLDEEKVDNLLKTDIKELLYEVVAEWYDYESNDFDILNQIFEEKISKIVKNTEEK